MRRMILLTVLLVGACGRVDVPEPIPIHDPVADEKLRKEVMAKVEAQEEADRLRAALAKAAADRQAEEDRREEAKRKAAEKPKEKPPLPAPRPATIEDAWDRLSKVQKEYVRYAVENGVRWPEIRMADDWGLINLKTGDFGVLTFPSPEIEIVQVLGDRAILARGTGAIGRREGLFIIEGISTADLTDDARIGISKVILAVSGTKTYPTVGGGTRTVKRLIVVNTPQVQKILDHPRVKELVKR